MKRKRTNDIYTAVIEEAKKQQLTTSELLAFLSYRENYISNRKFATEMLKVSRGEQECKQVPVDKAVAMVSRGRLGKSAYNYMRRMLRPHTEGVKSLIFLFIFYLLKTSMKESIYLTIEMEFVIIVHALVNFNANYAEKQIFDNF